MTQTRKGRPRHPQGLRERLNGCGPYVLPSTNKGLKFWGETYGLSVGWIIDALWSHCSIDPTFKLPLRETRKRNQKPANGKETALESE